ncbi:uncharacterized protein LOC126786395 [Argentina anserina]|uniref:uncharacterized protein LOC126786395 n=1 Tax=Argentina anserina TaxID=57926 RepID=UPI00217655FE|nr:uncharacterized protein LOC126786395 [Potentilla anserina]
MKSEMITRFPESLVNDRWKKDTGRNKILIPSGPADEKFMRMATYGELMGIFAKLSHAAMHSKEGYVEIREALTQMALKSEKYKAATRDPDDVPFEGLHPNVIRDPVVCRTKGDKSKASIPDNEEDYKSKVGKGCSLCKMIGHNARTCDLKNKGKQSGKRATQQTKVKRCTKQVVENMSENSSSDCDTGDSSGYEDESTTMPQRTMTSLMHSLEEARPLEFFTGYERGNNLESGSTSSGLPIFKHFKPFPDE